jgi:hypothetical protein
MARARDIRNQGALTRRWAAFALIGSGVWTTPLPDETHATKWPRKRPPDVRCGYE